MRQTPRDRHRTGKRQPGQCHEREPPAVQLRQPPGREPAQEPAHDAEHGVDAGDLRRLGRIELLSYVGDRDGEHEWQHQPLHEPGGDYRFEIGRKGLSQAGYCQ